jgi:hypothetical protein
MAGDLAGAYKVLQFTGAAHRDVKILLNAWLKARNGNLVPRQHEMLPETFLPVLPNVWMYRYDEDQDDFICRLAGERINNAWGHSLRGVRFREVVGDVEHAAGLRRWKAILNTPSIQYGRVCGAAPADAEVIAERLVLPLADTDGTVCYTIGISLYPYRQDDRDRTPPVWDDVVVIPCADIPSCADNR